VKLDKFIDTIGSLSVIFFETKHVSVAENAVMFEWILSSTNFFAVLMLSFIPVTGTFI
jgi:hypothetical protein